jgi:dipeptidyl aminopeptidase/acylaminoacyl peptidase
MAAIGYVALAARPPREFVLQTDRLDEASGLDYSLVNAGILWSHNDSGGAAAIYALDAEGKLVTTLQLHGITNRDWEDIAVAKDPKTGKSQIYIGEIGDNGAKYSSIKIYKVDEPTLNLQDTLLICKAVETIEIQYEDGPRDAEALFVEPRSGSIYIISKREAEVGVYIVAYPYSTTSLNIAKKIGTLPLSWVTAADISPNGKQVLLKTYTGVFKLKTKLGNNRELAFSRKPKALPYKIEPQGEGLCWDSKGKGYYTLSEASKNIAQVLYFYR